LGKELRGGVRGGRVIGEGGGGGNGRNGGMEGREREWRKRSEGCRKKEALE